MGLRRIQDWANRNPGMVSLIGVATAGMGLLVTWLAKAIPALQRSASKLAVLLQRYGAIAVWVGVAVLVVALTLQLRSHGRRLSDVEKKVEILETRPDVLVSELESANLSNWSYGSDQWASDQDGLSVTRSGRGGIYKMGTTWENYDLTFEFKIVNQCAGWIVRAASHEHYVMVQCNERQIRPHKHVLVPQQSGAPKPALQVVVEKDHGVTLDEWTKVRTEVRGHGIKVWIDGKMAWADSELLKDFPMGTVGFRCAHQESALFRGIRVEKK